MALHISIVTPEEDVLDVDCDEAVVPGTNGELGLLPEHIPLISALKPGVLTTLREGKRTHYVVSTGFVELDDGQITILTGSCERADAIDVDRAKKALDKANGQLNSLGPDEPGYARAQAKASRNTARLDGAARG